MNQTIEVWQGVLIEESLDDTSILSKMHLVATTETTLEGEAYKGPSHFHSVEVTKDNLEHIISFVSENIKPSWYFHLVNVDEIIVIFRGKVLKAQKNNAQEIETIRQYGISQGILKEQLELEKLFDNPFA